MFSAKETGAFATPFPIYEKDESIAMASRPAAASSAPMFDPSADKENR